MDRSRVLIYKYMVGGVAGPVKETQLSARPSNSL